MRGNESTEGGRQQYEALKIMTKDRKLRKTRRVLGNLQAHKGKLVVSRKI